MQASPPDFSAGSPQTVPLAQTPSVPAGRSQASPGSDSESHAVATTMMTAIAAMNDALRMEDEDKRERRDVDVRCRRARRPYRTQRQALSSRTHRRGSSSA